MTLQKIKSPKGFTLVEMLVVIAIIGVLASVSFPFTRSIINKGKVTETKMRMKEFAYSPFKYVLVCLPPEEDYHFLDIYL